MKICWPSIPSCPRPLAWCWRITSPWTPVPAASTPPPASALTTTRPACATAWTWCVPVDDQGRHTDYAGKYAGMKTDESNPVILEDLQAERLPASPSEEIVHSYPHCWRCKHPIIFRATPQWFCSVESFKDDAVKACDDIRWLPAWGKERMIVHDPGARRLVHLPSAPLGPAHPRRSIARTAASPSATTRPSTPSPSSSPPRAPTPGSSWRRIGDSARGLHLPPLRRHTNFEKETRHAGRLVRLRLLPRGLHAAGPGLLAC